MMWVLSLIVLGGCKNPCVDMCQQIDAWLEECGTTWEAEYSDRDWESVDDCYDAHWEASAKARKTCARKVRQLNNDECY